VIVYKKNNQNLLGRVAGELYDENKRVRDRVLVERHGDLPKEILASDIVGKVIFNTRSIPPKTEGLAPAPTSNLSDVHSEFGSVIERELPDPDNGSSKGNYEMLRLQTGEQLPFPGDASKTEFERALALLESEGDLFAEYDNELSNRWVLITSDLKLSDFPNHRWNDAKFAELLKALNQPTTLEHVKRYDAMLYVLPDGNFPLTLAFETREHAFGLMQIVGFAENPPGVKIRYKLLQSGASSSSFQSMQERVLLSLSVQPVRGIDLDSGDEIKVPEEIGGEKDVLLPWIASRGIDVMASGNNERWALWTSATLAVMDEPAWKDADVRDILRALETGTNNLHFIGSTVWGNFHSYDLTGVKFPQTLAFSTAVGSVGLMQITGLTENK
jgi:hypothetical protein